jgi:hypothetical protein
MFNIEFPFSSVTGYAEVQKVFLDHSIEMAAKAVEAQDLVYMEALRADTLTVMNFTIECVSNRYDYLTWVAGTNYINRTSKLVGLDKSGKLMKVIEMMEKLNAEAYYHAEVVPVFNTPLVMLIEGKTEMIQGLDIAIAEMREARA